MKVRVGIQQLALVEHRLDIEDTVARSFCTTISASNGLGELDALLRPAPIQKEAKSTPAGLPLQVSDLSKNFALGLKFEQQFIQHAPGCRYNVHRIALRNGSWSKTVKRVTQLSTKLKIAYPLPLVRLGCLWKCINQLQFCQTQVFLALPFGAAEPLSNDLGKFFLSTSDLQEKR